MTALYITKPVPSVCLYLHSKSLHSCLILQDALEAAMKGGLWGHALLLASKMDNRTHARVMIR